MTIIEPGILPYSKCVSITPSDSARELFYYSTLCGHYYCTERYAIQREHYPPMLLVYIRQGEMRFEYRGEKKIARRGDVALLDCTEPHYYFTDGSLEFLYLHFDGLNSHQLCRHITEQHGWLIRRDNNLEVGNHIYELLDFYEKNGIESAMEGSMRIYRMLNLLLAPTKQEKQENSPIEDVIQYIRSNVGKPITLDECARIARLNPCYFSHSFKQQTGFSPQEYIINTRLERAKVLLVGTNRSISDIAYEVGYSSLGSMTNIFTRRVGFSPSLYRRLHQSETASQKER